MVLQVLAAAEESSAGPDVASYIAAGAAVLAALFAGFGLRTKVQSEQLSWRRAAIEGAAVDFLTAAYAHRGALRNLAELEEENRPGDRQAEMVAARNAYGQMRNCLSRMRVLGSEELVLAATAVQAYSRREEKAVVQDEDYARFFSERSTMRPGFERDRDLFVAKVQSMLKVPGTD